MIEFKTGRKQKPPLIFANVEYEQFFVNDSGYLCQKHSDNVAHIIALPDGTPEAARYDAYWDQPVQRILPRVTKITFPGMEGGDE